MKSGSGVDMLTAMENQSNNSAHELLALEIWKMEQCPYHPQLQERVGKNESEIEAMRNELADIKKTLRDISDKLDSRYPASILWVMTTMGSTIGVLATMVANMVIK